MQHDLFLATSFLGSEVFTLWASLVSLVALQNLYLFNRLTFSAYLNQRAWHFSMLISSLCWLILHAALFSILKSPVCLPFQYPDLFRSLVFPGHWFPQCINHFGMINFIYTLFLCLYSIIHSPLLQFSWGLDFLAHLVFQNLIFSIYENYNNISLRRIYFCCIRVHLGQPTTFIWVFCPRHEIMPHLYLCCHQHDKISYHLRLGVVMDITNAFIPWLSPL